MYPSVSFVFAARTEAEANGCISAFKDILNYRGEMEFCYSTNGNIAHAMNEALAKAKHEVVVFIETDTVPVQGDWVDMLLEGIEHGKMMFSREVSHTYFNWAGTAVYKDDLGGLQIDEHYSIAEDTEYFERLKLKGLTMHRSDAPIFHLKEHETQKALDRAFDYGYLHAKLIEQYKFYPMHKYIQRLELQKQIAEETLRGIKHYYDETKS